MHLICDYLMLPGVIVFPVAPPPDVRVFHRRGLLSGHLVHLGAEVSPRCGLPLLPRRLREMEAKGGLLTGLLHRRKALCLAD